MRKITKKYTDMESRKSYKDHYPRCQYKYALIIAVLESYEYVRRQILFMNEFMGNYPEWEVIIVDDGSSPELESEVDFSKANFRIRVVHSNDTRDWSQPCARNLGAKITSADLLLFTDIDHVVTEGVIRDCMAFKGDKLHFYRVRGVLSTGGVMEYDRETLIDHHCPVDRVNQRDQHYNTFAVRHWIFDVMGGYDEAYCGSYGGDDVDFSDRYSYLCRELKRVSPSINSESVFYVYPDAKSDVHHLFHGIRHKIVADRKKKEGERREKNKN